MPQIVLDPADPTSVGQHATDMLVPPSVRKFGRVPEIANLLPGDVVLLCASDPPWASRIIQQAQKASGYSADDARWHHVAVYIGDGHVLEALPRGVTYRPLYWYSGTHVLRFRRDHSLTLDQRYKIAIQAMMRLRMRYSKAAIPRIWVNMTRRLRQPANVMRGTPAVVCSQLYWDAFLTSTGRAVTSGPPFDVPPAAISQSQTLADVAVGWLRLS